MTSSVRPLRATSILHSPEVLCQPGWFSRVPKNSGTPTSFWDRLGRRPENRRRRLSSTKLRLTELWPAFRKWVPGRILVFGHGASAWCRGYHDLRKKQEVASRLGRRKNRWTKRADCNRQSNIASMVSSLMLRNDAPPARNAGRMGLANIHERSVGPTHRPLTSVD